VSREVGQSHVRRALTNHEVDNDQALEDDGPCGIAQAGLQSAEDLSDAGLSSMCGNEDMLDIFCLWGRGLRTATVISGCAVS
jgi:hypothetical protein